MKKIIREFNGESIAFAKAAPSHIDGKECLYVGQAADGTVKLFESDSPEQVVTTTASKLATFATAVTNGEFDINSYSSTPKAPPCDRAWGCVRSRMALVRVCLSIGSGSSSS